MLKFGNKGEASVSHKCTIRLLDDSEVIECEFQSHHKGKYLLEFVCRQLNLIEKDYFALRYVDANKQRHWLDPAKTVLKQIKELDPILFSFRVKFYPPDPFKLKEEITRYQLYLQLRRDLLHGRLYCSAPEAALLGAYVIQGDLGDYDPEEHEGNYVAEHKLLLKQTIKIEEDIMELHQTQMRGQSPETTETNFLRKAYQLDTYGIDPHPVKDHRSNPLYLGINHSGIITLQGSRKTNHFKWNEVQKINYEGKMFIIHLVFNEDPRNKKKHTVGFKCPSSSACRHVWRCAVEQMLFFTLQSSSEAPAVVSGGGLFSWGTKLRYSGRTEKEIQEDIGPLRREEPAIKRTGSLRRKASSVPATPSTPVGTELGDIRYGSLPRANHSAPDTRLDGSGLLSGSDLSSPYCPDGTLPLLETVAEDQELSSKPRADEQAATEPKHVVPEHEHSVPTPAILISEACNEEVVNNVNTDEVKNEPKSNGDVVEIAKGVDEGGHPPLGYGDYYFRDSFEMNAPEMEVKSGRGAGLTNREGLALQPHPGVGAAPVTGGGNRSFNLLRVFVPSFLAVALLLTVVLVLVLETNSELFSGLRALPEIVILRQEYYEPAKEFFRQKLASIF
ncbi:FERM domain-containing protein 5 isoform X1 [Neocloeon triangulifer]|uniref:FERM domain-containing protein 5 isoform X1 n=1 Tax=Neocloeon triangulifer TaxID=2078957 RepID=UPI00286F51EC|nr:FERM domain-containing protein 5 isoform X1 [Neocloeon triangulifer]